LNNKFQNNKALIYLLNLKSRGYVGIHTTAFKDFLLRDELKKALSTCGFEHPSEGIKFS